MRNCETVIRKKLLSIAAVFFAVFVLRVSVRAQEWKEIVPLVSTCTDVKRILKLEECKFPRMKIEGSKYDVVVDFSTKSDGWDVSSETVVAVYVSFRDLIRLREFETNFDDYVIKPVSDAPEMTTYNNVKKGIHLTVQTAVAPEPYISNIVLYPSEANSKKFKRKQRD
jgi:hypothetical protein